MPYELQNPELILLLKFGLWITEFRSHFETKIATFELRNSKLNWTTLSDYVIQNPKYTTVHTRLCNPELIATLNWIR